MMTQGVWDLFEEVALTAHAVAHLHDRMTRAELTKAERIIVIRLVQGYSTSEVCAMENIRPKTFEWYLSKILQKTGKPDRLAALLYLTGVTNDEPADRAQSDYEQLLH